MSITFNEVKAKAVFLTLAEAWRKQDWIFKKESLPQSILTLPSSPRDKANALFFFALLQRGPAVSESATRWIKALLELRPEMVKPEKVSQMSKDDVTRTFEGISEKMQKEIKRGTIAYRLRDFVESWRHNASVLDAMWQADAREIFKEASDFEEAYARVDPARLPKEKALWGAKRKIFSLLQIFLGDEGLIDEVPGPIPVDFHAQRVTWACDIVEFNSFERALSANGRKRLAKLDGLASVRVSEKITDAIALWSQKFMQKLGVSNREINPALWILSRTACKLLPQNRATNFKKEGIITLSPPSAKRNPCAACPIQKHCNWAVPNAPHSRFSYLVRQKRETHPLLLPLWEATKR